MDEEFSDVFDKDYSAKEETPRATEDKPKDPLEIEEDKYSSSKPVRIIIKAKVMCS